LETEPETNNQILPKWMFRP